MVNVGFICEGFTESYLLSSAKFKILLESNNIKLVRVINAEGCGNLLPHNINGYIQSLEKDGAEKIVILTDLDTDVCITQTKRRISARVQDIVIIAVKQIEAWFLASSETMRKILNKEDYEFEFPENENTPFETIRQLLLQYTGEGVASKVKLINKLLTNGLDLKEAYSHPNCSSAEYFINKLKVIGRS